MGTKVINTCERYDLIIGKKNVGWGIRAFFAEKIIKSSGSVFTELKKALLKSDCDVAEIEIDWLLKVEEREFPKALYKLALRYEQGDGVEHSYEEAAKWYIISAKQGNESAKCKLVDLYALGKGVEKSTTEAISWLEKCKWDDKCGNECKEFCISNYLKKEDKKGGIIYISCFFCFSCCKVNQFFIGLK